MTHSRRALLVAAALAAGAPRHALAQGTGTWPTGRPIRLVVGFPPGGSGDFLARTLGEPLARELGGSVIVDNRPGAAGNMAAENVARSEPDGYTLLLGGSGSHAANKALYRRLSFDPVADFTPITRISDLPTIICVRADSPVRTLPELIERVRREPRRWNYATPGNGTPSHIAGVVLNQAAGLDMEHIPFRGGAPSLQAVLSGDVQVLIGTPPVALPQVRQGNLRALSLTTRQGSPVIPEAPGTEVAGLPALDVGGWWGMWGPAKLPDPIRDRVFTAMRAVLAQRPVQERMAQEGLQVFVSDSPEAFGAFVREQLVIWGDLIRRSGAVAE